MDTFIRVLNPILMILLGLGAGIAVARLRNVEWRLYGLGALTFIGSQVLHIPFNLWVLNPLLQNLTSLTLANEIALAITALALGLSAGVFEETSRYLVYRFGIQDARQWKDALMFGAGHGGIEAIILGVLTFLSVLQLIALSDRDLSQIIPAEQLPLARAQFEAFWSAPWYAVLLGALERLIALCFHIAASVLVLQVFRRHNILWLMAAIGLHAGLNAIAVYVSQVWGPYMTEGILAVFALFCLGIIYRFKQEDAVEDNAEIPAPALSEIHKTQITTEQIEDSKYV